MGNVTNVKIEPMKVKFNGVDLGYTDGDVEVSIAEDLTELTAHQTGTNILSELRTGKQVEVTITLKETSAAQLKTMLEVAGGSLTTPAVTGYGFHKDFTHTFDQANELVLHPVVLSDADETRDWTFWKAYPKLESLAFSGENILTLPVTFKCYPDTSKDDKIMYFSIGANA